MAAQRAVAFDASEECCGYGEGTDALSDVQ